MSKECERLTIGFFGLGTMGAPMIERLRASGFRVAGVDRDATRNVGATHAPAQADVVISCVTDAIAVAALYLEDGGLIDTARPGQVFIDHTTTSSRFAREAAARAAERGAMFIDAPISGGAAGARAGTLSVFAGGTASAVDSARGVLAAYASRVTYLGGPGSGQLGKMANQIAIAGTLRGLAEAVAFARGGQLDVPALLAALAAGSAHSNQLDQHAPVLAAEQPFVTTFAWLAKDLDLALAEAHADSLALARWVRDELKAV